MQYDLAQIFMVDALTDAAVLFIRFGPKLGGNLHHSYIITASSSETL